MAIQPGHPFPSLCNLDVTWLGSRDVTDVKVVLAIYFAGVTIGIWTCAIYIIGSMPVSLGRVVLLVFPIGQQVGVHGVVLYPTHVPGTHRFVVLAKFDAVFASEAIF